MIQGWNLQIYYYENPVLVTLVWSNKFPTDNNALNTLVIEGASVIII